MSEQRGSASSALIFEQYKSYVHDLENIGLRHENSRKFYLTVISALFVFLTIASGYELLKSASQ